MARRKRNFIGNQVMRDLVARHPKYPTAMHLWRAMKAGKTFMDTGIDCIKCTHDKRPEFNRNMVGFVMNHQPCGWGMAYGPVTLTGWHIFTYSGRGSAHECSLADGRMAWLSDLRLPEGVTMPTPNEPFEPIPDALSERKQLFFGVRVPRSIRFFDCRTAEGNEFRRNPITPYDVGNTQLIDGEWKRVPHMITDLGDGEYIATLCGFRPFNGHYTPHSCSHYTNTREPWAAHWAADFMMDVRKALAKHWREYRAHKGGKPVWVEFNNYGWGINSKYQERS